jgi:hypothetical protein
LRSQLSIVHGQHFDPRAPGERERQDNRAIPQAPTGAATVIGCKQGRQVGDLRGFRRSRRAFRDLRHRRLRHQLNGAAPHRVARIVAIFATFDLIGPWPVQGGAYMRRAVGIKLGFSEEYDRNVKVRSYSFSAAKPTTCAEDSHHWNILC